MELDEETWKTLVTSYEFEYKDLCDNWKIVESKAQSTITLACVLLAASFATSKDMPESYDAADKCLFSLALLGLALCISTAVWSLWIRSLQGPPVGGALHGIASNITADASFETKSRAFGTITDNWATTNESLSQRIDDKACLVASAQVCLAWSGALIGYLTITLVNR